MNTYVPLHCHSFYSLLDGLPSPKDIVKRAVEIGSPACALTDHGSVFGLVKFKDACKKSNIKCLMGIELYICKLDPKIKNSTNKKRFHLTVLAKNPQGIESLIKLVSETNKPEHFYYKPRITVELLKQFTRNKELICLSGCVAGELSSSLFLDVNEAFSAGVSGDISDVRKHLNPNWKTIAYDIIKKYQDVFGKENYFIEIQTEGMLVQDVVVECLREIAKDLGIPAVATLDSHYCRKEDADDHRILLYSQLHTTQEKQNILKSQGGDTMGFFHMDTFYMFDYNEMDKIYTPKEIENTLMITDMVEDFNITRSPYLPKYSRNTKETSFDILKNECIKSAKIKLKDYSKEKKLVYWERLQKELLVIKDVKLEDYFLIVSDCCRYIDKNKWPRGKGRGSGSGSLINFLMDITGIDPIKYGLYFERFFNASRSVDDYFNCGDTNFIDWLNKNYKRLLKTNKKEYRTKIISEITKINRYGDKKRLKEEIKWIENNNTKMWVYIDNIYRNSKNKKYDNKCNSQILYSLGLTDTICNSKPIQITNGHISLPDIDTDVGIKYRSNIIEYLENKWGQDKVCQMVTFGRLQGRAALKEVFRAEPDTVEHLIKVKNKKLGKDIKNIKQKPVDLCNEITKYIPDEAQITDELQQTREETENPDYGILQWSIDNIDFIKEQYQWFKPLFDKAIRIEGTKKSQSRHAAGVIISSKNISDIVPLVYDTNSKKRICGIEMQDAEKMGCVKFDFLGIGALDKIKYIEDLVNKDHS